MTSAEAAEVILQSCPLVECSNCGGDGKDYSEDTFGYLTLVTCRICVGFGFKIAAQYSKACTVVGLRIPSVKELMEDGAHLDQRTRS